MPNPIPLSDVLDVAVAYVVRRQIQGRPTTLRQLSKRIGLGVSTIRGRFEEEGVDYVLIALEDDSWASNQLEIAIRSVPERIAERSLYTVDQIKESYRAIFGDQDPVAIVEEGAGGSKEEVIDNSDPYHAYRITGDVYRKMKGSLISFNDLADSAMKKGYSRSAVLRAVGGDRLIYEFASPIWRPYIYQGSRFYSKEVLKHLGDILLTYKRDTKGAVKEIQKRRRRLKAQRLLVNEGEW